MVWVRNVDLSPESLPPSPAATGDLFRTASSFDGYEVWGGFHPCAQVANQIAIRWRQTAELPSSLTLLRTGLYFEARRERFVDYGGFGDDQAGYERHHDYMRVLLESIRNAVARGEKDAEDNAVADW